MSVYSEKELSQAVYYPACGVDFCAVLKLANKSDLFIYVDWSRDCWSQSKEEYLERQIQIELPNGEPAQPEAFEDRFQPANNEELRVRYETVRREAIASNRVDWGLKGEIIKELEKLNNQPAPDSLYLLEDNPVPIDNIGSVVINEHIQFPLGFEMIQYKRERYNEKLSNQEPFEPWARELKLRITIEQQERILKLLYVRGEGIATYCALFDSGRIAPKILVTVQSGVGLGGGFITMEDPNPEGIMSRFLLACEKRPELWVRGRDCEKPKDSPYNILVGEYTGCWEGVAAFRQQN